MIDWHRLLGLFLLDWFADSPWTVEVERDLSVRKQRVDVLIVRGSGAGQGPDKLPDGLEPLADHNLITYKSLREPLADWTLKELTGHYTNYRKQVSPSLDELLPESQFQMIGVSTRYPRKLAGQLNLEPVQPGVYDVERGTDRIRIIVLSQIPRQPYNSIWHLFSGMPDLVEFGAQHYQPHAEFSTVLNQLYENYQIEGLPMPYTLEDFHREVARQHLDELSPEERVEGLSSDERLKGLSAEEVFRRFSPDERLEGLSSDERLEGLSSDERLEGLSAEDVFRRFSPDERLKGLSAEQIRAFLKRLEEQENGESTGNGEH